MGLNTSHLPSRDMLAVQSCMKLSTHQTIGSGMWQFLRVSMRCACGIVSKNPVMSKVSIDTALLWFHAALMSCMIIMTASWADLLEILPYWVEGNKLYLAARYANLLACILSSVLPNTSSPCFQVVTQVCTESY